MSIAADEVTRRIEYAFAFGFDDRRGAETHANSFHAGGARVKSRKDDLLIDNKPPGEIVFIFQWSAIYKEVLPTGFPKRTGPNP
jgi:hypothetical protein